jgi:solute carrier family 25 (mitochondrial S-adenosylmethionine transporter), member 26
MHHRWWLPVLRQVLVVLLLLGGSAVQSSTISILQRHPQRRQRHPQQQHPRSLHPIHYRRRQRQSHDSSSTTVTTTATLRTRPSRSTTSTTATGITPSSTTTSTTTSTTATTNRVSIFGTSWKAAVAGSIAGAVATTVLYPLDAAKTLRQAHLATATATAVAVATATAGSATAATTTNSVLLYTSVPAALRQLIRQRTVYVGFGTAIMGAIPSSALYFGAYATAKSILGRYLLPPSWSSDTTTTNGIPSTTTTSTMTNVLQRCCWHGTAAAIGNLVSSAVFVPKELIKQQMQYHGTTNVPYILQQIVQQSGGWCGLYTGYRATVLRNIPSAVLRFTLYEEFKRYAVRQQQQQQQRPSFSSSSSSRTTTTITTRHSPPQPPPPQRLRQYLLPYLSHTNIINWRLFVAGAAAGAMASGIMTPMDLIKTKLSTGTCPIDSNTIQSCIQHVVSEQGIAALWTGAGSRMISSAAFSAIGLGTYETVLRWLQRTFP